MADLTPINLPTSTNPGRHDLESSARLINCYTENLGEGAKHAFALYAVNGWEGYATLTGASGGVSAMLDLSSELLVTAGRQVYTVSPSQAVTLVGGFASDGLTTMARNRRAPAPQVMLVRDGQWGTYQGGKFTPGSDVDLPAPISVTELNGRFVTLSLDGQINWSSIDDNGFDGLDFANAESSADAGVAISRRGSEVVVFGTQSMEFFQDAGASGFIRNQAVQYGCFSSGSVAETTALIGGSMLDSIVWAATDQYGKYAGIYLLNGYNGSKISTYAIDRDIEADPSPAGIRSFAWSENGHSFYTITGSSYSHTYDTVEGRWHERQTYGQSYWQISATAAFGGNTLFGDSTAGKLYRSSRSLYDAAGNTLVMEVRLPITHMWPYRFILNRVKLDGVTGVGMVPSSVGGGGGGGAIILADTSAPGSPDDNVLSIDFVSDGNPSAYVSSTGAADDSHVSDPQVMLDWSTDGGRHFGGERSRSLGATQQIHQPLDWYGFGLMPETGCVLRFRISAGVRRCVMGVAVDADRLAA